MRIRIISVIAITLLTGPAFCARPGGADGKAAQWFGVSRADLAAAKRFAGRPLRVKARFVRELSDGEVVAARGRMNPGRATSFLVVAEGGEIRCEMSAQAKRDAVVHEMKPGTPLVIHGTLDASRNVFLADTIVQGWGRGQTEGGS